MKDIEITPDILVKIIEWMSTGKSPTQVAAELSVSKEKLGKMAARPENEELREALELGKTKYEAFMETVGMTLIGSKVGKEAVWKSFMAKHFSWADKSEIKENSDTHIQGLSKEELDAQIAQLEKIREI